MLLLAVARGNVPVSSVGRPLEHSTLGSVVRISPVDIGISVTLALRNIKMYERFKCNEIKLIFVLHTIKN